MISNDEKIEVRRLKNLWIRARLEGNAIQANFLFDKIHLWYILHMNELSFMEYRAFEIFFHMNGYL